MSQTAPEPAAVLGYETPDFVCGTLKISLFLLSSSADRDRQHT
jgi:hypothetical protein